MIRRFFAPGEPSDFDDPVLRARLKAMLADEAAPAPLVESVERIARQSEDARLVGSADPRYAGRDAWAEFLPRLCGLGLCGSLVAGALINLPIGRAFHQLGSSSGSGSNLSFLGLAAVGLLAPLFILVMIDALRGAPTIRKLAR